MPQLRPKGVPINVAPKFLLVLVVLAIAILALAGVAVRGLDSQRDDLGRLYANNLLTSQLVFRLSDDLHLADRISVELLVTSEGRRHRALKAKLDGVVRPAVAADLTVLRRWRGIDSRDERAHIAHIGQGWQRFERLATAGRLDRVSVGRPRLIMSLARQLGTIFEPLAATATRMTSTEVAQAKSSKARAARTYATRRTLLLVLAAAALLVGLGIVVWLIRTIVPRLRQYSRFASQVARGDLSKRLTPTGRDELSDLGVALNDMVDRRQLALHRDQRQATFVDAMQMTISEQEAHVLIKRHIERSVSRSSVTVLNRNNSEDRLEPVTAVPANGSLAEALTDAKPRSCLAVRFARPHPDGPDDDTLIGCEVCAEVGARSTCQPLLVGGEVIGAVLVEHEAAIDPAERACIRESVTQAAPVLANLRTLAIAEVRAATDALTGLANKRSVHDHLTRMVAHASRAEAPLAAVLLDLDCFKQINDTYGHVKGDEALATVGAVLKTSLRESDFAGRYGGEEFILLLPDTDADGAQIISQKLRQAIATIKISGIDRDITASLGIALYPHDAGDTETLVRHADRALYSAKSNGRNRVETFATQGDVRAPG